MKLKLKKISLAAILAASVLFCIAINLSAEKDFDPIVEEEGLSIPAGLKKPLESGFSDNTSRRLSLSCWRQNKRIHLYLSIPAKDLSSDLHNPWVMDLEKGIYVPSSQQEAAVAVLLMLPGKNPAVKSEDEFLVDEFFGHSRQKKESAMRADVWYWGANRTRRGNADDLWLSPMNEESDYFYSMLPDAGKRPWQLSLRPRIFHSDPSRYKPARPSGSRADVQVSSSESNGFMHIHFSRAEFTGFPDDIDLRGEERLRLVFLGEYGRVLRESLGLFVECEIESVK